LEKTIALLLLLCDTDFVRLALAVTSRKKDIMTTITGNTYPVRDALKALGGRWNPEKKGWDVPDNKADEARKLIAGAPAHTGNPGTCSKCRKPCKAPYTLCWACKCAGSGVCVNCGGHLDTWERQHRVKRCADCRDGGSMAHGGQSYYDRHGNFVLGDED
jgi:hypothetical protein